ncbi:hypothetical protein [Caulifigura coniformis]|uniref:hypothetical protein n=1 Tax=Caulifigura coniformis TaxID=2527983 RepID=UPI0011A2F42F|nr:hypothetical protein [Caulifigura coniformis]
MLIFELFAHSLDDGMPVQNRLETGTNPGTNRRRDLHTDRIERAVPVPSFERQVKHTPPVQTGETFKLVESDGSQVLDLDSAGLQFPAVGIPDSHLEIRNLGCRHRSLRR